MSFGGLAARLDKTMQDCARCHGEDGMGRDGTAPKIAGQSKEYLLATLRGYASGERSSGIMQPIAAPLSDAELDEIASRIARKHPSDANISAAGEAQNQDQNQDQDQQGELIALGQRLAAEGDPPALRAAVQFVPRGRGRRVAPRGLSTHRRAGAPLPRGLASPLSRPPLWRSSSANVMHFAATGLTDHQINALATWYSSQPYVGEEPTAALSAHDSAEPPAPVDPSARTTTGTGTGEDAARRDD